MKVTEQIDAMRALGTDPIQKLVKPRLIATCVMLPCLTAIADFVGMLGGFMIATLLLHLTSAEYWNGAYRALDGSSSVLVKFVNGRLDFYLKLTGQALGDFTLSISDAPACTVGFLPPSSWRSPEDLTDVDTPDGLYCKLPQDSPIGVRGSRNTPCMGQPGKRAPTAEICESPEPYTPLAMRQHALGAYPIDPSLVAQGVPPDSRIDPSAGLYGPVDGTQMPPSTPAAPPPPGVAPSAFQSAPGPSVAIATYDPQTGKFVAPDGAVLRQSNLAQNGGAASWTDLMPT